MNVVCLDQNESEEVADIDKSKEITAKLLISYIEL